MSQCVSTPTATQFGTFTTEDVSTSLSQQVTTLAPTTSTIFSTICSTSTVSNSTVSECSTSTILTTIDGGTSTTTVAVPITVTVTTSSPSATLFSTSCGENVTQPPSTPSVSSSIPSSTNPSTSSAFTSESISTSTSINADGSTITVEYTSTFVVTPSSTQTVTTNSGSSTNVTPIAAGVAGGVGGLVLLVFIWWFLFRRKRRDDYLDDIKFPPVPEHHGKPNLAEDLDIPPPEPYPFGHPGHHYTNVPPQPQSPAEYPVGLYDPPVPHSRNPPASAMSSDGTNPYTGYVSVNGSSSHPPPPTIHSSEGRANGLSNHRPMLGVANPGPNANVTYPPDVKDRTLYLRADTGYQYRDPSGAGSSATAITQQQTGSPAPQSPPEPLIQHQDGGVIQSPEAASSSRPLFVNQESTVSVSQQSLQSSRDETHPRPSQGVDSSAARREAPPAYSE